VLKFGIRYLWNMEISRN